MSRSRGFPSEQRGGEGGRSGDCPVEGTRCPLHIRPPICRSSQIQELLLTLPSRGAERHLLTTIFLFRSHQCGKDMTRAASPRTSSGHRRACWHPFHCPQQCRFRSFCEPPPPLIPVAQCCTDSGPHTP